MTQNNAVPKGAPFLTTALDHPKAVTGAMFLAAMIILALAVLPSVWPAKFPMLAPLRLDTDPENMLSSDAPVRVFHNKMKKELALHDIVVVGIVNEKDPNGVFNPRSLANVQALTEKAKTLQWPSKEDPDVMEGVVVRDLIAPSTVDNIEQGGVGTVNFSWLMPEPPKTQEEALALRDKAMRLPFLKDTLVSADGKALALYVPITDKTVSYRVYQALKKEASALEGDDQFYITGLPVAEDTFGVEMFYQMAISAPLAMLVIFLLMLWFFRKIVLILSPLILALISVIFTMGLLIITGNTVHIMSSMIPIFIMPIAVLDSIHILSEFFDRYPETNDRRKTISKVMHTLFRPMLFTSLTSAAGFASLALTPIPPVQIFGIFVALGISAAWFLTVTFIPAYVMLLPKRTLENFGHEREKELKEEHEHPAPIDRALAAIGELSFSRAKTVLTMALVLAIVAGYGVSKIVINDNPIKWFNAKHPIRVADRVMNQHFGGTYMAYLALMPQAQPLDGRAAEAWSRVEAFASTAPAVEAVQEDLKNAWDAAVNAGPDFAAVMNAINDFAEAQRAKAEGDAKYDWDDLRDALDEESAREQVFKQPEALEYIADLQEHLLTTGHVGKSNSLADLVKTVHRELLGGEEAEFRIPDSARAVAQCIITYEGSHRPYDLEHFTTPGYRTASLWVQLTSGDNRDMSAVVADLEDYIAAHPAPFGIQHQWFGLTYINVIWQDEMVSGMLEAFLGSFLVVMLMMTLLFRSALWGLLCMIPLTLTIGLIYGVIGLVGKDYDMPVAVLSSLTLGLAVDFAIHFLSRTRTLYEKHGNFDAVHGILFGEPARAIFRNVVVIAVGFLPLLASSLVPYKTVGFLLAAILFVSGAGTLILLPALVRVGENLLFPKTQAVALACRWGTLTISTALLVAFVEVNLHQFLHLSWPPMLWAGAGVLAIATPIFYVAARHKACRQFPAE